MALKKVVLFDLDDTLYEYKPVHHVALKEVYKILKKEIKMSFKRFEKLYEMSVDEIHREFVEAFIRNPDLYSQYLANDNSKGISDELH